MVDGWWLMVAGTVAMVVCPTVTVGQELHRYVHAAFTETTQRHSAAQVRAVAQSRSVLTPLGGTRPGGTVAAGVWTRPWLALEGEASFGGRHSSTYRYLAGPSFSVDVEPARRDTYLSFNLRTKAAMLEPVAAIGIALTRISRHATTSAGRPYFDDAAWKIDVAAGGGLDAAISVSSRFSIVPTFRVLYVVRPESSPLEDPLAAQTRTGRAVLRYGVGARVAF